MGAFFVCVWILSGFEWRISLSSTFSGARKWSHITLTSHIARSLGHLHYHPGLSRWDRIYMFLSASLSSPLLSYNTTPTYLCINSPEVFSLWNGRCFGTAIYSQISLRRKAHLRYIYCMPSKFCKQENLLLFLWNFFLCFSLVQKSNKTFSVHTTLSLLSQLNFLMKV